MTWEKFLMPSYKVFMIYNVAAGPIYISRCFACKNAFAYVEFVITNLTRILGFSATLKNVIGTRW